MKNKIVERAKDWLERYSSSVPIASVSMEHSTARFLIEDLLNEVERLENHNASNKMKQILDSLKADCPGVTKGSTKPLPEENQKIERATINPECIDQRLISLIVLLTSTKR